MKPLLTLAAAVALSGCSLWSKPPADIVLVSPEAESPHIPSSCNPATDPRYKPLPHTAITLSVASEFDRKNAEADRVTAGRRASCFKGLTAQQKG